MGEDFGRKIGLWSCFYAPGGDRVEGGQDLPKDLTTGGTSLNVSVVESKARSRLRQWALERGYTEARHLPRKAMDESEFFTEYGEGSRYHIQEVIGRGSYGVVCSAVDSRTGEKVAIKKINDIFEHVSDATRILREIKLLRLLRHPDIVEVKHIMLPPSRRDFKDIYVVFELMESDLHQVIKANDDLTPEHYQFFLYQLLRSLKYVHTANVFHRDLKPKNVLANADCKLKICDFGLARVAFSDAPTAIFWTDYVATRWYRAPELCGSFFSKYTPAIDIWSIGCIFAEVLTGRPLFPGKNVVHQLELMTDLLGTPSQESIAKVRNEKARRYLSSMRKKPRVPFQTKFPRADPAAVRLLERMLAFDPSQRPTAEEGLADPYFKGLAKVEREPSAQPITKLEFEFERRRINMDDVRELIYREILEYHPHMLKEYLNGTEHPSHFLYPSAVDQFKRQFAHLEEHYGKAGAPTSPLERQHASLPRERVAEFRDEAARHPRDREREQREKERDREREERAARSSSSSATSAARGAPAGVAKPGRAVGGPVPGGAANGMHARSDMPAMSAGAHRDTAATSAATDLRRFTKSATFGAQSPFQSRSRAGGGAGGGVMAAAARAANGEYDRELSSRAEGLGLGPRKMAVENGGPARA